MTTWGIFWICCLGALALMCLDSWICGWLNLQIVKYNNSLKENPGPQPEGAGRMNTKAEAIDRRKRRV